MVGKYIKTKNACRHWDIDYPLARIDLFAMGRGSVAPPTPRPPTFLKDSLWRFHSCTHSFLWASWWVCTAPSTLDLCRCFRREQCVHLQRWNPTLGRAPALCFLLPSPILLPRTVDYAPLSHTKTLQPAWSQRMSVVLVACLIFLLASSLLASQGKSGDQCLPLIAVLVCVTQGSCRCGPLCHLRQFT